MKKSRNILLLALFIVSATSITFAQERKVYPVDEGNNDESFAKFRETILQAAKKHDAKYILSILDVNIENSFGGNGGIREFKKQWNLQSPQSKFWNEFITVLSNGGTFSKEGKQKNNIFQAPYTFTQFPEDIDAFEYQAIFGNNVNLRSRPEITAPIISVLSYNVVKVDFNNSIEVGDNYSWLKVETLGGKSGFVQSKYVRSAIDYRAIFEKKKGTWKMAAFIAGD